MSLIRNSLIALLFCTMPLFAQDAKVMPIEPADAAKAKQLYEAKLAAEKAWDDYQTETAQKYLTVAHDDRERGSEVYSAESILYNTSGTISVCGWTGPCKEPTKQEREAEAKEEAERAKEEAEREKKARYWRAGWDEHKFDWSKDFKFIVPKAKPEPEPQSFMTPHCSGNVCW